MKLSENLRLYNAELLCDFHSLISHRTAAGNFKVICTDQCLIHGLIRNYPIDSPSSEDISQNEYIQLKKEANQLLTHPTIIEEEGEEALDLNVNKTNLRRSSTRLDYLGNCTANLSNSVECFLSASSLERINTSDMSNSDECNVVNKRGSGEGQGCVSGRDRGHKETERASVMDTSSDQMIQALINAVDKIDLLTSKMQGLEKVNGKLVEMVVKQEVRLSKIEDSIHESENSQKGATGGKSKKNSRRRRNKTAKTFARDNEADQQSCK